MRTDQIVEIARRYYEDNMPQDDIAGELAVSRSTVSRAIKVARERGWVRTVVVAPSSNASDLEGWLRTRFKLDYVAVVPVPANSQDALEAVARAGAAYVDRAAPESGTVAVAGGRTLTALARQLRPNHRPDVTVVSAVGGWVGQSAIGGDEVAREVAARWDAQVAALFAPAFVSHDRVRQALLGEKGIRDTIEKGRRARLACIGVAAVTAELSNVQERYASSTGLVSEEDTRRLLELGAVGETCAQFFDSQGNPIDAWNLERTIALPLRDFRNIPTVLAVGAGAERAQAFLGACRGRLLTALIIGEDVAHEMERLDNSTRQIMEAM